MYRRVLTFHSPGSGASSTSVKSWSAARNRRPPDERASGTAPGRISSAMFSDLSGPTCHCAVAWRQLSGSCR